MVSRVNEPCELQVVNVGAIQRNSFPTDLYKIEKVEPQNVIALNVCERTRIQEWVRKHSMMLGAELADP